MNLEALASGLLAPENEIQRYFTAPVSGKFDPGVPVRQQRYLQALRTLPSVSIHEGNFLTRPKMRPLVNPAPDGPTHVEIWNTEEKGSDVNLATYLVHDAWRDLFDLAIVLSQDTDLNEPVRIVRDEIKKSIGISFSTAKLLESSPRLVVSCDTSPPQTWLPPSSLTSFNLVSGANLSNDP